MLFSLIFVDLYDCDIPKHLKEVKTILGLLVDFGIHINAVFKFDIFMFVDAPLS